ncbi:hypothetical protein Pst134EA_022559 [Puccinia striiformis f. sp. tritici]|uniref:hypothetical protein n=1 Tax=Puccinia striiformis f. sp. tritici TaxID=168172 RepID=UPI002007F734|nr:hypothetical protein Pst134EA_022559 [Puccinia striiformis f. sp. tritici]KAH9455083.1 hypothetical protein Pst134EA_022559 [Puccinia striiformis f. sp. tritici]
MNLSYRQLYSLRKSTPQNLRMKRKASKERWKKLAREMHVLKREAKDYISTIERFKDKVSKFLFHHLNSLQLELLHSNELIIVKPPSPSPVTSRIPISSTSSDLRLVAHTFKAHVTNASNVQISIHVLNVFQR